MEIELLFRNGDGEDSPFKVNVSDYLCHEYEKLGSKIVVEANLKMATMYFKWSGPVVMLHVPLPAVSIAVEKMIEMGIQLKSTTDVDVVTPPAKAADKPKQVRK